jgi:iron(III) transport system permease protein|tara:strand:+ start:3116 stop:4774 length:1659 start_codon:yes stop_codon:yes gene_type:complete
MISLFQKIISKINYFFINYKLRLISTLIVFLLLSPIISIIFVANENTAELWAHLLETRFSSYIYNTIILMIGVGTSSIIIGVTLAWLVCRYDFFMSKVIEWCLLLPLAMPAYIVAYCYTDFFEYSGTIQSTLRIIFNWNSASDYYFPEIRSLGGAIFVMSFVLYPYVYFISKIAFKSTPVSLFEIAEIHGKNLFLWVAIPLARPAIIAGVSLVLMETISDFGTVEFFAVETITLGIFNLWLGMNNLGAASQLALVAFTFIIILLGIELSARKKQKFNDTKIKSFNTIIKKVTPLKSLLIFGICLIPIIFGFLIPISILFINSLSYLDSENWSNLISIAYNSFFISSIAALAMILISIFIAISIKFDGFKGFTFLSTIAGVGYAFPGTILALGTLFFITIIQDSVNNFFNIFGVDINLVLIGSYTALIFAYVSRFNAVAFGAINSGINRIPPNMIEASQTLGHSFIFSIKNVILPLLRPSIITAAILSFVDIIKELPITLLLRPFNFETLATFVYQYANDEMLEKSSIAAILIVLIGLVPILIMSKAINKKLI